MEHTTERLHYSWAIVAEINQETFEIRSSPNGTSFREGGENLVRGDCRWKRQPRLEGALKLAVSGLGGGDGISRGALEQKFDPGDTRVGFEVGFHRVCPS